MQKAGHKVNGLRVGASCDA